MQREQCIAIRKKYAFEKSNVRAALEICLTVGFVAVGIGIYLSAASTWISLFSIPFFVIAIFRCFSQLHESAHNATSANTVMNDVLGILSGCVAFLPYEPWKKSHLEHHLWAGNVDKDPVMAIMNVFPTFPAWLKAAFNLAWRFYVPLIAVAQHAVFWILCIQNLIKKPDSRLMIISTVGPIVFWAALLSFAPWKFSLTILLPTIFAYLLVFELVGIVHHLKLPQVRGSARFPVWQQFVGTRTCVYPKWCGRIFVLNFNYHTEHHIFPDAPWYYLDKLHNDVSEILGDRYNTSNNFNWSFENRSDSFETVLLAKIPARTIPTDIQNAA